MARRWTNEEEKARREELVELYVNKNKTIGEIGKILGIAESTVFDRLRRLRIKTLPEKKSHYKNRKRDEFIFPDFSKELAEFFGIMLGDGHRSSGQIWIFINNNTDRAYLPYVKALIQYLFEVKPGVYYRKEQDMKNLFLSSVDLTAYLREKGLTATNKVRNQIDVPKWILKKDSFKKSFLRGFFDTDGSIYKLKFGIQMAFCNRALPLLRSARGILVSLGYSPSKVSGYNFYLTRRDDLRKYCQEIRFGNPKHFDMAKSFGIV